MSQYIIKYTDPLKSSFNVQPYTTNGRVNPTLPALDPGAVTSNSSLLIYGKGMPDYGQNVQTNMLHLLENFASPASEPPLDQTEGQLWYNNTALELKIWEPAGPTPTIWSSVLLDTGTAPMRADFDLNNNRILNVPTVPGAATDAVNEQYVLDHTTSVDLHLTDEQNQMLDGMETILGLNLSELDNKLTALNDFNTVGDTLTVQGALDLKADKVTGGVVLNNIATLDASGNLLDSGAQLSDFGAAVHTHPATEVNFTTYGHLSGTVQAVIETMDDEMHAADALLAPLASPTFTGTVQLGVGGTLLLDADPIASLEAATKQYVIATATAIATGGAGITIKRKVVTSAGGTLYYPPAYDVGKNELSVYVNGQKYYQNGRGFQEVYVTNNVATGLANDATTYSFNITVDGGAPQLITVTGSASQTFDDLVPVLDALIVGASATVSDDKNATMIFKSDNQYSPGTSSISITDVDLFATLTDSSYVITEANAVSNFFKVDENNLHRFAPGVTFNVVGSTGNDGGSPYTVITSSYDPADDTTKIDVASVVNATADGNVVQSFAIQPAVAGSTQGYYELGAHNSSSSSMQFNATVPTVGQIIEFIVTS